MSKKAEALKRSQLKRWNVDPEMSWERLAELLDGMEES